MDPLSTALSELNVQGKLYFQKSLTLPWSVNVHQDDSVIRFHIVQSGHCYVRLHTSHEPILVEQGDIVLVSQGESHTIYSDPCAEAEAVDLNQILDSHSDMTDVITSSNSESGEAATQMICGHYTFSKEKCNLYFGTLPTLLHRKNNNDEFNQWMKITLELCASKNCTPLPHSDVVVIKAAEIALTLVIRMHLNSQGVVQPDFNKSNKVKH